MVLENTEYCKLSKLESFIVFGRLIGNHVKLFQENDTASNILLCELGYDHHVTVNALSETQLSCTTA